MKAISVILPVLNVERFILKCLSSINDQTFKDFNLIIIDDNGDDNSIAIAVSFLQKTSIDYTILRNNGNLGISESRNVGIQAATADYILFVDPDDWIEQTMLEELYEAAIAFNADIVACNGLEIWEKKGVTAKITTIEKGVYTSESYLKHLFRWEATAYLWLRLIRRDLFTGLHFHKGMLYEDFLLFPYLIEKADKIIQIESTLYNYIRRNDSITMSRPRHISELVQAMKKLDIHFRDKTEPLYTLKYNYTMLYFLLFNIFKFSIEYKDAKADLAVIKIYLRLGNLLRMRNNMASIIWLFLVLAKLNGQLAYFLFKKWHKNK